MCPIFRTNNQFLERQGWLPSQQSDCADKKFADDEKPSQMEVEPQRTQKLSVEDLEHQRSKFLSIGTLTKSSNTLKIHHPFQTKQSFLAVLMYMIIIHHFVEEKL